MKTGEEEDNNDNKADTDTDKASTRLIVNGKCSSCDNDSASEQSVCCLLCNMQFHVLCKDHQGKVLSDNICSASYYKQYVPRSVNIGKRLGNFVFVCDPCLTKHEQKVASDTKSHVKSLERKIDSLESDIADIKSILVNNNHSPSSTVTSVSTSSNQAPDNIWDDKERVKNLRSKVELVVEKSCDKDKIISNSDIENIVLNNAIHVHDTYVNTSGNTVLVLPTQNDRNILHSKLKEQFPESSLREKQELLPTISVSNITENFTSEKLLDVVLKSHPEIKTYIDNGAVFNVLNIRKQSKNNMFQANIRLSNNIRKFIEHLGNRLYIGLTSCKVYDHFHVKRCNKCQKYGHYQAACTSPVFNCGICSINHDTNICPNKENANYTGLCINCKQSKVSNIDYNHKATAQSCQSYKNAQLKLRNSIVYYSKN